MLQIHNYLSGLLPMILLLCFSAFFSASETALFSISKKQITLFKKSKNSIHQLIPKLLENPQKLLSVLLLANMFVNILYFANSASLAMKIQNTAGITAASFTAVAALLAILLAGEIIPKSFALVNPKRCTSFAALPLYFCVKILNPFVTIFRFVLVEPVLRIILGPQKSPNAITTEKFIKFIESTKAQGLISQQQNYLISRVMELTLLKVKNCLWPRVDMIACDVTTHRNDIINTMTQNNLTSLPIFVNNIDNIIGQISLRQLILNPETEPDKLVQRINFVPEQKNIESLLDFFKKTKTDTTIVVDEFGQIAGSIQLEDIAEELLGPITPQNQQPIQIIDNFKYRLDANLPLHDWAKTFKIDPAQTKIATVAGMVTAMLGKIPKPGDHTRIKNLNFTVEKVEKNRIVSIILTLEPIKKDEN